ncbi:MAG: ABC transporter ATP-binding protein [Oceanicaulis sp.]
MSETAPSGPSPADTPASPPAETPAKPGRAKSRALAKRLWKGWLADRPRLIGWALLLSAITAGAASGYGLVVQQASQLLESRDMSVLWLAPALILAIVLTRSISLYFQTLATNRLALSVMRDLQTAMFDRLITADFARLSREPVGSIISRFTNDITMLREGLIRAANNLMRDTLTVAGCIAVMLYLDWALTLVVLVVLPLAAQPVLKIGKVIRKRADAVQTQMGDVSSFLEESFSGARVVKTFSLEPWARGRAKTRFLERYRLVLSMVAQRARIEPVMEIAGGLALAVVFGFAGWRAVQGATDLSDLLGFIVTLLVLSPAARALASLSGVLQEGFAVLDRVFNLLDEQPGLTEVENARPLKLKKGAITAEAVTFGYSTEQSALENVTIEAAPGETIALVGPSGSGKSTLLNLFARLYDPRSGRVTIDGQDIAQATMASVRGSMALVSQDVTLFDDTIAANIALGRLDASRGEIEAAAKAADAHEFIMALADGYNAPAGPKGSNLSGGQRQRIAIARAILKDAPILLLDEATSALDAASEARVQRALERLSEGRTTIVIAHRLSTVRKADRIYVMKDGGVVEAGTHDALMAQGGLYAELSKLQLR